MDSVRIGVGVAEYQFWWGAHGPRTFTDRPAVVIFLQQFKTMHDGLPRLRELLEETVDAPLPRGLDDDAVIEQLATLLFERRLRVRTIHRETPALSAGMASAPPPPVRRAGPAPSAPAVAPPPPEQEADEGVDSAAQAQALVQAAEDGVPFCEECEKARQRQMAA